MASDSIDYQHVDALFCAVEDQNQDVTTIANGIKGFAFKEDELMYGARVLYSKACISFSPSFSIATKCVELANALANVTVGIDENPFQSKSFQGCIVHLAILELMVIRSGEEKNSSKQADIVKFLVLLYKAEMLSVRFVDYWLKSLEPVKNSKAAKTFIESFRNVKSDQIKIRFLSQQSPKL